MKKNILTVVILALLVIDLIISAVIMFSVVPAANKTNRLVTQVCEALDLELASNQEEDAKEEIPIDQLEVYNIEDKLTINLKKGEDGKDHWAIVSVSLSMNKDDDDYDKYQPTLEEKISLIQNEIISGISEYTMDEFQSDVEGVQQKLLERIQKMYNSKFIVKVAFRDYNYQ